MYARGGNVDLLHVCEGGQCRATALAACMKSNVENQSCHPSTHNEKQALGGFKSEWIVRSLWREPGEASHGLWKT